MKNKKNNHHVYLLLFSLIENILIVVQKVHRKYTDEILGFVTLMFQGQLTIRSPFLCKE